MSDYDPKFVPQKNYFLVGQKCILYNSKNEILLLKRSEKSGGGGWSVPGGGLDKDEDPVNGIEREVMEEAGLQISDIQLVKAITFRENKDAVLMIVYKAKAEETEVKLNWEHDEWQWITKEEALNQEISETLKDFIRLT